MKKRIVITGLAFTILFAASAQDGGKPPKPHKPPKPPVERMNDVPPPPDAPLPPPPPPPAPPPPNPTLQELKNFPEEYQQFLEKNPGVSSLSWNKESVIITLKSGKVERYILSDAKTNKEAGAKYGKLPAAPAPPPPPPPAPPKKLSKKSIS